jgi:hypothetical protein
MNVDDSLNEKPPRLFVGCVGRRSPAFKPAAQVLLVVDNFVAASPLHKRACSGRLVR